MRKGKLTKKGMKLASQSIVNFIMRTKQYGHLAFDYFTLQTTPNYEKGTINKERDETG